MNTVYEINDREAGNKIEVCASLEQAEATVRRYEEIDIAEGTYTPNFYEIVEIAEPQGEKKMNAIKIQTDAVTAEYPDCDLDAAAVLFAAEERIRGVTDMHTLIAKIERLGGWVKVYADDEEIATSEFFPQ